jgi:hypothetical protein
MQDGNGQHGLRKLFPRMIESLLFPRNKSEITLWISFFFALGIGCDNALFAWQQNGTNWTDPSPEVVNRIERANVQQWESLVHRTARAILGETWEDDLGTMPPQGLPSPQRVPWLAERLDRWMQSPSFPRYQSRSWIVDRCEGDVDTKEPWDFRLHDDWVRNSISSNESFLTFVEKQLAGDIIFETPEAKLATAAWFRCSRSLPDRSDAPFSRSLPLRRRSSPTLDDLPENLKWTYLSQLPWLYSDVSESQRARLLDAEAAMVSVLKTEQRDWERLLREDIAPNWHRAQSTWPLPNPADMTFHLSERQEQAPADLANARHSSYGFSKPWRHTEPWTIILEIDCRDTLAIQREKPIVLVRQRSADSDPSNDRQNLTVDWRDGAIGIHLIHSLPHSYLSMETEPIFRRPGVYTLAIVYEGLPCADALRVWVDGQWLAVRSVHDQLVRDFASEGMHVLDVWGTAKNDSIQLLQFESYRCSLSSLELEGWRQTSAWKEWESCSEQEQRSTREHYARRVDLQWRYQRESLSFYANSFASVLAKVSMVPVAEPEDSPGVLMFPGPFARSFSGVDQVQGWTSDRRKVFALDCRDKLATVVAENEVARQWHGMLGTMDVDLKRRAEGGDTKLREIAKLWSDSWNRRELMRALVFSEDWVATALDSPP